MKINQDGQVTIPAEIREKAGLLPDTDVTVTYEAGRVWIAGERPDHDPTRGDRIVEGLRGKGDVTMTTDEIMSLTRGE